MLHRDVARVVQHHPAGAGQRVGAGAGEAQALGGEGVPQGGEVAPGVGDAAGEAVGGRGAELDLTAGFEGEDGAGGERVPVGAAQWQCVQCGVQSFRGDGFVGTSVVVDEPLQLDADQPGRADLEADAGHVVARGGFGQRGHRSGGRSRGLPVGRTGRSEGYHRTHHPWGTGAARTTLPSLLRTMPRRRANIW